MPPTGTRHALAVVALIDLFIGALAGRAAVRVQNPVTLDEATEAHPDIALVRCPWTGYPGTHPGPADIFLIVEVADASLAIDTGPNVDLGARADVREYWVVDLTSNVVRVHRQPADGTYAAITRTQPSGTLAVAGLPGLAIPASALFV